MKKILERLRLAAMRSDDFKAQLFAFLGGEDQELSVMGGETLTRESARLLLQELIPARIEVRDVCSRAAAAVAAAPHVSFDNWAEYFCNRAAREFHLGRVIALNYRDQDGQRIPVPIGRHVHVNRPFESSGPGRPEHETARAREVHEQYLAALAQAAGRAALPIDVLLEFHSHRRTPYLEIATRGLAADRAEELVAAYESKHKRSSLLPELRVEPLHKLQLKAEEAKAHGSLRAEVARYALHIEVPREARQDEKFRAECNSALIELLDVFLTRIERDLRLS